MAKVRLETTLGAIVIELDDAKAPISCANFLEYVDAKHYDGTLFHRVIDGFMIQGGGYDKDLKKKPTRPPIENEAKNGLLNERATVAMARTSDIGSATSQFFVNVVDNAFLNHKNENEFGYAVFARVVEGMDVVDKIKGVSTGAKGQFTKDCPVEDVAIISVTRVE